MMTFARLTETACSYSSDAAPQCNLAYLEDHIMPCQAPCTEDSASVTSKCWQVMPVTLTWKREEPGKIKSHLSVQSVHQQLLRAREESASGGSCSRRTGHTVTCAGEQEPEQAQAGGGDRGAGRAGRPPAQARNAHARPRGEIPPRHCWSTRVCSQGLRIAAQARRLCAPLSEQLARPHAMHLNVTYWNASYRAVVLLLLHWSS